MVSRYSIIQYVPNPIADERINVGVLAFDEDLVRVRFLNNWERVRHFGREDPHFLQDFASRREKVAAQGLLFPGDFPNQVSRQDRLLKVAQGWFNSVQFTEPRGSLETVEFLIDDLAKTYLVESCVPQIRKHDRAFAVQVTKQRIKKVLESHFNEKAKQLFRTDYRLSGCLKSHQFDVVVANGKPYFAAQGVSFDVKIRSTEQDSMILKISDVKQNKPDFPLAIVTVPPQMNNPKYQQLNQVYEKTTGLFSDLGAEVLTAEKVEGWVSRHLGEIEV
ncbi:DUF3037 domain-containing protein [Spirulina subsalsa]|uniref:DUF3037 domain-containing protein n=1 Tax=Spirulina subsalsa TaxID=54311 RepID=UPI0002E90E51|nr:DUF3037 domain-containing protein [Spirulina subsalsa]